jgi:hypothetical protein
VGSIIIHEVGILFLKEYHGVTNCSNLGNLGILHSRMVWVRILIFLVWLVYGCIWNQKKVTRVPVTTVTHIAWIAALSARSL